MSGHDELWWDVQRRLVQMPALRDRLLKYLRGANFAEALLDALEDAIADYESAVRDCEDADVYDGDAEEVFKIAAEQALARYGQGGAPESILLDLLTEVLGSSAMTAIPQARERATTDALRRRIAQERKELCVREVKLRAAEAELAKLEAGVPRKRKRAPSKQTGQS